jgi:hypothetical protein
MTPDLTMLVNVAFEHDGLGIFYQNRSRGQWKRWEPTEVDGYPAVIYQYTPDQLVIDCYIVAGISESSTATVRYGLAIAKANGKDACAEGRAVVSAVLSTIKADR